MSDYWADMLTAIDLERMQIAFEDKVLLPYLKKPSHRGRKKVVKAAIEAERIPGGYFGTKTILEDKIEESIDNLLSKNKQTWGVLLSEMHDKYYFNEFKAISPFTKKEMLRVSYGKGFITINGLEDYIDKLIGTKNNLKIQDYDNYTIFLDLPDDAEVTWTGSGMFGQKGPRKQRE